MPHFSLCEPNSGAAMNKAFMREPEPDGRAFCPRCQALGEPVGRANIDHHVQPTARSRFGNDGWFCSYPDCDVAYFDLYDRVILVEELREPVYPKSLDAAICPCFGFTREELDEAIELKSPAGIRELLAKSKTPAANCSVLAAGGRCCVTEVQKLYIRGLQE